MRLQRDIASVLAFLLMVLVPIASHALVVRINAGDTNEYVLQTEGPTVNLDCPVEPADPVACPSTTLGAARVYDFGNGVKFSIARCGGIGCSGGRARVTVSDGAVDTLVLTDAVIKNIGTQNATLNITMESGAYTIAGEPGPRAYAAEISGSFVPSLIDTFNQVIVSGRACYQRTIFDPDGDQLVMECFADSSERSRMIDSPAEDSQEDGTDLYSLIVPPYKPAGTSQFSPKEQDNLNCPGVSSVATCVPGLFTTARISLKAGATPTLGYSLRLPGSIGVAGSKAICDPNTPDDPARQRGCIAMANYFAKLGPKGAEMYEARLEPSPGSPETIQVRNVANSDGRWTAKRGGDDDEDDHQDQGVLTASKLKVELETNGTGEVRVLGLCSVANGCQAISLPVRVYCGETLVHTAALHLTRRGDGTAELSSASPCNDPAVLIMDPLNERWVAAPRIL
jgi:hypothetical protein